MFKRSLFVLLAGLVILRGCQEKEKSSGVDEQGSAGNAEEETVDGQDSENRPSKPEPREPDSVSLDEIRFGKQEDVTGTWMKILGFRR